MLVMVTTTTATGFGLSFPEVGVVWDEEALVVELQEAVTDLHPGDLNTESLFPVSLDQHAFFTLNCSQDHL